MADYFQSAVAIPSTAAYAPRPQNFDWIASLANAYQQGAKRRQQANIEQSFKGGMPVDRYGNPDYRKIADILATNGDVSGALKLGPLVQMEAASQGRPLLSLPQGANGRPAGAQPVPRQPTPVRPQAVQPVQPQPPLAAGQTSAPVTVNDLVGSLLGGLSGNAPTIAANIAKAAGVTPTGALDNQQQQRVYNLASRYAKRGNFGPVSNFTPFIIGTARKYGLDPAFFNRQINQESSLNPNVADSAKGAQGIAQFEPGTAADYGVNPRDPYSSIDGAARYMADLTKQFGNEGLALAAYNWGPGNVRKWLAAGADPRQLPKETQNYVQKVTGEPLTAFLGQKATRLAAAVALQPAVTVNGRPVTQGTPSLGANGGGAVPAAAEPAQFTSGPPNASPQAPAVPEPQAAAAARAPGGTPVTPVGETFPLPVDPQTGRQFEDPAHAVYWLNNEIARLSANPYAKGEVAALQNTRDQIEKNMGPMVKVVGGNLVDLRSGKTLYESVGANALHDLGISQAKAETLARYYMRTGKFPNLGFGAQANAAKLAITAMAAQMSAEDVQRKREAMGLPPLPQGEPLNEAAAKYMADLQAAYAGSISGARSLGTRAVNIRLAANLATTAIPSALDASRAIGRTRWTPVNAALIKAYRMGSNVRLSRWDVANLQIAEMYARALNPQGSTIREDMFNRALGVLSQAKSPAAYRETLHEIYDNMQREETAIGATEGQQQGYEPALPNPFPEQPAAGGNQGGWTTLPNGVRIREINP